MFAEVTEEKLVRTCLGASSPPDPILNRVKYWFLAYFFGSDWYSFHLILILKPNFSCWSTFALSWVDKVSTGT